MKVIPLMETIIWLPLMLLMLCLMTTEFLPNTHAELMNCLQSDQEALIDFKNGLHDPENHLSSWKGSNCCQWRGISCENSTGAVITVDLHNPYPKTGLDSSGRYVFSGFSGEIRSSLTKLKSLRHLDLSFNNFNYSPIPKFFGYLKNLQYLSLSHAGFSGAIPQNLGNLSSLQYLDVESLGLLVDNLEWVTGLVSLKHLMMNDVNLSMVGSDWIRSLNNLQSLTELHLSSCSLSGSIPPLTFVNITSLVVLDLSHNTFNSKIPNWLVNITNMITLDISRSVLFGKIPLGFGELPNLQILNLVENDNLIANCYQLLMGPWEKIEVLNLVSNKIHGKLPTSIGNMTFLNDFRLAGNKVEGAIPRSIGKLCNLMIFQISSNNLTGTLPELLEVTENCLSRLPLPSLQKLGLSDNHLVGKLPEWLGHLESLIFLYLNNNSLFGPIPDSLGLLKNLIVLSLENNELNGTLPESLGQLSELDKLDVSSNHLTGIVTETHFSKQGNLTYLALSSNSFTVNVSSNWVPPFQLRYLSMHSCHLGPSFPLWLKSQKHIRYINFSNASIYGTIPFWFWEVFPGVALLNVSFNHLEGRPASALPFPNFSQDIDLSSNLFEGPIPFQLFMSELLDLSNNRFSGPIPSNVSFSIDFLFISNNQINGEIPASICEGSAQVIDLSNNSLTGSIPSCIGNSSKLKVLDLSKNNLSGNIPGSLGQLSMLQTLHLNDNKFSGELPSTFQNLSSLETLDLGNNRLMGRIPPWIGADFQSLRILILRPNAFFGELPSALSNLSSLQVLDLSENQLNGSIPACFGDFKAMSQVQTNNSCLFYGAVYSFSGSMIISKYYEENVVLAMKGQSRIFNKILSLVVCLDLSGNSLTGDLPGEITKLLELVFLNLSGNHISGHIPKRISELKQLSSLDVSSNKFTGAIPRSLASLSFLGYMNLSNNNFTGRIPYKDHLTTFEASTFAGNPGLCGDPLALKCPGDDPDEDNTSGESGDSFVDEWFYLSIGLGFATGILVPYLIMAMRKSWSVFYFDVVDDVVERILYLWLKYRTIQQRTRRHHQGR